MRVCRPKTPTTIPEYVKATCMKIHEFIQTHILLPRLHQSDVLVVYDPDRRYGPIPPLQR